MRRTVSICILLLATLVCVVLFLLSLNVLFEQEDRSQTDIAQGTETESGEAVESDLELDSYQYILLESDGQAVVYCSDNTTVYLETGIRVDDLSAEESARLETGIRFQSEQELFDFLESYSS